MARADPPRSEFIRRSLWRNRTTPGRRAGAAAVTFAVLVAVGLGVMLLVMLGLDRLGAPGWVVALPWIVPTAAAMIWSMGRPAPAVLTDDDDDSWIGYAIRLVMVGDGEPRARPARAVAAAVFGAPVGWAFVVFGLLELIGIF